MILILIAILITVDAFLLGFIFAMKYFTKKNSEAIKMYKDYLKWQINQRIVKINITELLKQMHKGGTKDV